MAQIVGEIVIQRPIGEVFDFIADERNEPRYNPQMTSVEQVTDGDIGLGTQFRADVMSGKRLLPVLIEFTTFDRPSRLGSRSTMSGMEIQGELIFEAVDASSTKMRWEWDLRPTGVLRLLKPLMVIMGRRQERDIWTSMKRCMES